MAPLALRRGTLLVLLALLTLAGYGRVLEVGFLSDDFYSLYGQQAYSLGHLFSSNLLGRSQAGGFYRPFSFLEWRLDYWLHGLDGQRYNRLNLALYLAVVMLVYLLARRITGRELPAFIGAAAFALHPAHVEAVAWLSARVELGCALFFLLAVLAMAPLGQRPAAGGARLAVGLFAFLVALLHKEMAFTLPGVLVLADALRPAAERRGGFAWRIHLSAALLLVVFLVWRAYVLGDLAAGYGDRHFRFGSLISGSVVGGNLTFYADWLLQPLGLPWLDVAIGNRAPLLLPAVLLVLFALLWAAGLRPSRRVLFGLLWIPITLVPVLTLSRPQYLFLPSVGFCLLLGLGGALLLDRLRAAAPLRAAAALAFSALLLAYGTAAVRGLEVWIRAGEQVRRFERLLRTAYPELPPGARCVFVGLPVNIGAPVFQNGIEPALRMWYGDFTLRALRAGDFGAAAQLEGAGPLLLLRNLDERYLEDRTWRAGAGRWRDLITPEQGVDLGPGAANWSTSLTPVAMASELAIVSSLHNGRPIAQDRTIGRILLISAAGEQRLLELRAGRETCEWSVARPDPTPPAHLPLAPAVSWLDQLPDGRAFAGRAALARFPLAPDFAIQRIELQFVGGLPEAPKAHWMIRELALRGSS